MIRASVDGGVKPIAQHIALRAIPAWFVRDQVFDQEHCGYGAAKHREQGPQWCSAGHKSHHTAHEDDYHQREGDIPQ
jgi:hypothetical protein